MYHQLKHAPKWLCVGLMAEEMESMDRPCPDCAVQPGSKHLDGCDVARCSVCKGQLLSCDCQSGEPDTWKGIWPGVQECFEKGYVVFDTTTGYLRFDLNREAQDNCEAKEH